MQSRSQIAYPEGGGGALPQSGWTNKVILNDPPLGVLARVYRRRRTFFGRRPTSPQVRAGLLPDAKGRVADAAAVRSLQSVCAHVPYRLSMPETFELADESADLSATGTRRPQRRPLAVLHHAPSRANVFTSGWPLAGF